MSGYDVTGKYAGIGGHYNDVIDKYAGFGDTTFDANMTFLANMRGLVMRDLVLI